MDFFFRRKSPFWALMEGQEGGCNSELLRKFFKNIGNIQPDSMVLSDASQRPILQSYSEIAFFKRDDRVKSSEETFLAAFSHFRVFFEENARIWRARRRRLEQTRDTNAQRRQAPCAYLNKCQNAAPLRLCIFYTIPIYILRI